MKQLCKCGCGLETKIITVNNKSKNLVKGNFNSFIKGHGNSAWNKGLTKDTDLRVAKYGEKIAKSKIGVKVKPRNLLTIKRGINHGNYKRVHSEEDNRKKKERALRQFANGMSEEVKLKIRRTSNESDYKEKARARRLKQKIPNKFTSIEIKTKEFLDELHIPYKTHKSVMGITQPDFFIEPNICVYCDGNYWHNLPNVIERDKKINEVLKFAGYKVIRLWEKEIKVMQINEFENRLK